jgi:hypothetical protein
MAQPMRAWILYQAFAYLSRGPLIRAARMRDRARRQSTADIAAAPARNYSRGANDPITVSPSGGEQAARG